MTQKPARAHKSKREKKRLAKVSDVRIIGEGFMRRVKRPKKQGKKVKSVMIRVDAAFAEWCRKQAEKDGSITEVTRKLLEQIQEAETSALSRLLVAQHITGGDK